MIEDEIFAKALDVMGIKRTKDMYEKAKYPHICSMCAGDSNEVGYKLKSKYVHDSGIPYLFICQECWESLPSDTDKDL